MSSSRALLAFAAVAIGFAAADTYVVVLALPDMMAAGGLDVDDLQRAAPIVSGFLLGYIAILPLIGRISDVRGRLPVLTGCLVVFAIGSVVTAAAYDLDSMVVGRFVQGLGGGGLIPPTLALVADAWPAERRGLPLGLIGAVQELGSVLGPLYGAIVLAVGDWRDVFWLNAAVGTLIAAAILRLREPEPDGSPGRWRRLDWIGLLLALLALTALVVVMAEPESLTRGITSGLAFIPVVGESRWLTPLALALYALVALFVARQLTARRPLVALRQWPGLAARIDLVGAGLLSVALGAVIVTFASADPERHAVSANAPLLLGVAALAVVGFALRQRLATDPLIPRQTLTSRPAWGAVLVSFVVGASLIAALVDIPLFARLTVYRDSQLDAALVLVRFLVALPVGAVLGGWLLRRVPAAPLTAVAMLLSAGAFWHMTTWGRESLNSPVETVSLLVGGLGFGLAIAPVNAALLEHTREAVHGVASALLVVARMVGMLIGVSALTALGLRSFHAETAALGSPAEVCDGATSCATYTEALLDAGIAQLHTIFAAAAVLALAAAVLSLWALRPQVVNK
ncbi:MAG: MFS transporter [Aeromicrobium sp.]|uniref:MFS transporter n=1 Tax=Aeromicrobium sp. TaxID=1871063 RepID=UPI0039E4BFF7